MPWREEVPKLVNRQRCLRVTLPHLGTFHRRHTTYPSLPQRGFSSTFFSLWKVTQLTKVFLCLALKRKGDFSHCQLCKLTLTPKSKAGIFLALVSLIQEHSFLNSAGEPRRAPASGDWCPWTSSARRVCWAICRGSRALPRRNSGSVEPAG